MQKNSKYIENSSILFLEPLIMSLIKREKNKKLLVTAVIHDLNDERSCDS